MIVEIAGLTCGYGGPAVLQGIDLEILRGQFIGLIGPSGSGKSTLIKAILGKLRPDSGSIKVLGQPVKGTPRGIGYVPQRETVDWTFPVTVAEVVRMGLTMTSGIWPWTSAAERQQIERMLEQLGLDGLGKRHISELSGGQQQRVFLARALISQPGLLLLDEPTTGLDIRTRDEIIRLLSAIHQTGVTILMTSHELNAVAACLPRIICLNRTILAQGSPEEVFTSEILSATYGAPIRVTRQDGVTFVGDVQPLVCA